MDLKYAKNALAAAAPTRTSLGDLTTTPIPPSRLGMGDTHSHPQPRSQLLLITNRKSDAGFPLIPTSMILNDLERRNSPYFAFFSPNSIALLAKYVTVVEYRPMMSVNIVSQFQSSTSGHN